MSCGIKRVDAIKRAQEDWKRHASSSEEYFTTIRQAEAKVKSQKTKPIESYFIVQVKGIYLLAIYNTIEVQSDHSDLALDTFTYFYKHLLFLTPKLTTKSALLENKTAFKLLAYLLNSVLHHYYYMPLKWVQE